LPLKNLKLEKITQTSSTNIEHNYAKIKRLSTLNEFIITFWLQHHSPSLFWFKYMPLF